MFLSYQWLQDLVNLPSSTNPENLGKSLTMHTVEIDGVANQADKFAKVVVGKILAVEPHPNADRLQLAQVDVGEKNPRSICCGASNLEPDQKVAVALPGACLVNGLEIKAVEVRGEKSSGMICAEDELGLGSDHSGIMVLDPKAKIGQNLATYLDLNDTILEVDNKSITNRPDLWGHVGLAREIACFLETKTTKLFDQITQAKLDKVNSNGNIEVKVENFDLCPRYMALKIDNIKVEDSPKWLQKRLTAAGVRPINNIVDVTNYVMLELGQPIHAFDSNLIKEIIVRQAKEGEEIITLDGETRKLEVGTLVIASNESPLAIAGIMGGENSEISSDTTSIILESANFEATQIRKSSQKLGLRTESSMRFEKSSDPNLAELGLARAKQLLEGLNKKIKSGSKAIDIYDLKKENFGLNQAPIKLEIPWLLDRIGQKIEKKQIITILSNLGFKVEEVSDQILEVVAPSWRATKDIAIKEDLVEEIARIYGYENIEPISPQVTLNRSIPNQERVLQRQIKTILSLGLKMIEVYNYSFIGEVKLTKMGIDHSGYIKLANPLVSHHSLLRQNLVPNMLDNIKLNQPYYSEISIFELGSVYLNFSGEVNKDKQSNDTLPYQEKRIGLVEAGDNHRELFSKLKGKIENLLTHFDLDLNYLPGETSSAWTQDKLFAQIVVKDRVIGGIGRISKKTLKNLGIKKEVVAAEINWPEFYKLISSKTQKQCQTQPKYPAIERDLAFVIEAKILYNNIREEIEAFHDLIERVELFDVYQGEKLGKNKKSLAFHITYRSPRETLIASLVEKIEQDLIKRLENKFGAQIRDF